ncbi:hypothetical protein [Acetilactobacillus jinshanensis]|uniref:Uncharacterized protein n=1 Tax=Acetilactobacillus jinshanensis TaxID=1720083 RepID=A0A4P6ZKS7_9LACO|nr:hypothetical protein [Acetilactobacillus jinshanensis]QBP18258.1 hypothetical protein ELX58_03710 [Acetilactobacillus jinshanensis]URL61972.1 hypothetical protein HGK75_08015 [uncultured bacterium]
MRNHFNRNSYLGIFGIIVFFICIWRRFSPAKLPNYGSIMSDTISFASFITCLMFIGLAYLPMQSNSKFMHAMQDLQTDIVIMHQILITITIYFSISVTSLLSLSFKIQDTSPISIALASLWLALLITGILEVSSLLFELFRIILYVAEENKHHGHGY